MSKKKLMEWITTLGVILGVVGIALLLYKIVVVNE